MADSYCDNGVRNGSSRKSICNKGGTAYITSLAILEIARDFVCPYKRTGREAFLLTKENVNRQAAKVVKSEMQKGRNDEDYIKRRLRKGVCREKKRI